MSVRTFNPAQLNTYDGASKSVLFDVAHTRVVYLTKRLEELPKEIEEKKLEQTEYREEVERLNAGRS